TTVPGIPIAVSVVTFTVEDHGPAPAEFRALTSIVYVVADDRPVMMLSERRIWGSPPFRRYSYEEAFAGLVKLILVVVVLFVRTTRPVTWPGADTVMIFGFLTTLKSVYAKTAMHETYLSSVLVSSYTKS